MCHNWMKHHRVHAEEKGILFIHVSDLQKMQYSQESLGQYTNTGEGQHIWLRFLSDENGHLPKHISVVGA